MRVITRIRGRFDRLDVVIIEDKLGSIEPVEYDHGFLLFLSDFCRPWLPMKSLNSIFATYFSEHPGSLQSYTGTALFPKRSSSHNLPARNCLVV